MRKICRNISIVLSTVLSLAGCSKPDVYTTLTGFALGTTYQITVGTPGKIDSVSFLNSLDSIFSVADASMSVYNPNSLLNRLNRNETDSVDPMITYCIEQAARISELSGGVYDITVKPLSQALGFTGEDAASHPNIDSLLQYVGYQKIRIEDGRLIKERPEIQIELNSIAKGYTVDLIGNMIAARDIKNYLVEVGGEVVTKGLNPKGAEWSVGIDRPIEGNMIPGEALYAAIRFTGRGMATSGNYRRFYTDADGNKVVHTINARTGQSRPSNLLSATVIAENSTTADALGTMMMAIGLEESKKVLETNPQWMGYLIYADKEGRYRTYISHNMKKHIVDQK